MIGILTFHRAVNYGAVLQCYALQNTLNELGIENEVIDYRCSFIEKYYAPQPSVSPIHLKHFLKELREIPVKRRARMVFDDFLQKNIHASKPMVREELSALKNRYEAIITGSDQVWHLAVTGEDTTYLLDFAANNIRKISYAASIGPEKVKEEYIKKITPFLKEYDVISVREPSAIEIVEKLSKKKANVDVDPTVLPSMKIWECLVQKSTLKKNKFVFVYVMQKSDLLYDKALEIAKKYDLTILSISMVENDRKLGKDMRGASVEDFLWMIKNAEYVITNSFHGIMMSLRFHKEFYWAFQQGAHMSNPRFQMLIDDYGIDKCCCNNVDQSKLDYKIIDEKMESQRHQSIINLRNYNRLSES